MVFSIKYFKTKMYFFNKIFYLFVFCWNGWLVIYYALIKQKETRFKRFNFNKWEKCLILCFYGLSNLHLRIGTIKDRIFADGFFVFLSKSIRKISFAKVVSAKISQFFSVKILSNKGPPAKVNPQMSCSLMSICNWRIKMFFECFSLFVLFSQKFIYYLNSY